MTGEYTCSLNEVSLEKARQELNEDPSNRLGAVETLREWINQQKHLKCNTSTDYLLGFLRTAKFSQLRAREMLEGHLWLYTEQGKWYQGLDPANPSHLLSLSLGMMVPLPGTDKAGRKVILFRQGAMDKETLKRFAKDDDLKNDVVKSFTVILKYLLFDENVQVNGITYLNDMTGYSMAHFTSWSMQELKDIMKFQGRFPGRFKGFYYYNVGSVFETMMDLIKPFMGKKFKERIKLLGNNLENVYKEIPMEMLPEEYLPDDYTGPCAGSIKQIIDGFIEELQRPSVRDRIVYESSKEWHMKTSQKDIVEQTASFRKLNVD